ncbi:MAG: hypothetical protein Q4G49_07480, partial [Paracoccus sp. (in: a-proteobacteria)]|nr:hypothetical protein [Paracoccus sp. (in: a-proteobacteria)]
GVHFPIDELAGAHFAGKLGWNVSFNGSFDGRMKDDVFDHTLGGAGKCSGPRRAYRPYARPFRTGARWS